MGVREDREGPSSYRANKPPACSRVNVVCECVGLWVDDKAAQPFPTLFLFTNDWWKSKPEQTNRWMEMPAFLTKITQKLLLHPHLQTSPIFLFLDSTYGEPKKKKYINEKMEIAVAFTRKCGSRKHIYKTVYAQRVRAFFWHINVWHLCTIYACVSLERGNCLILSYDMCFSRHVNVSQLCTRLHACLFFASSNYFVHARGMSAPGAPDTQHGGLVVHRLI